MKLLSAEAEPTDAFVVISDGSHEVKVLKAMAGKYDHGLRLKIPEIRWLKAEKGLVGMVRQLVVLVDKTKVTKYLVLIDKEHLNDPRQLEDKLKEYGFTVLNLERPMEGYCKLELSRGPGKKARVYVAILGLEKSVEENLARLIELQYGDHVKPTKKDLKKWFEMKGKDMEVDDIEKLIEKAPKGLLEKAFPTLTKAIHDLQEDP